MEKAGASLSTSLVQWCSFQLLLQFLLSLAPLGSHLPEQQRCRLLHMFSPSSMEQQLDQVLFLRFSRVLESLDLAGCQNCFQVPLLGGWQHICQIWSIVCFMGNKSEYKKTTEEVAQTIFLVKYHKLVFHQSRSIQEPFRVFLFFSFPSFFFFFSVEMANLHLTLIISFCRNYNSCNVSSFLFFFLETKNAIRESNGKSAQGCRIFVRAGLREQNTPFRPLLLTLRSFMHLQLDVQ